LRPSIPIERNHAVRSKAATCSDEGGRGVVAGIWSEILLVASSLARCAAIFRMLSPFECAAVSVVDEPVEDGVGIVPIFDRHLAGDDGRSTLMAIIDDFEEIATLLAGERREAPIVESRELHVTRLMCTAQ
jgi:hypothetical protein